MEATSRPVPSREEAARTAWAIVPGVFLAGIGGGIVFPILPVIGLADHLAPLLIGFILAANRVTRVLTNTWVGTQVDRFGGKRLLAVGLAGEVVVMGIYWLAVTTHHPATLFLGGRLLWGPASGAIFIGGQTLALHAGGPTYRGFTSGTVRAAQSLGSPAGMVFGGIVAGTFGDGAAFLVGMAAALVAAVVAFWRVPNLLPAGRQPVRRWREVFRSLVDRRVDALAVINFVGFFSVQGVLLATMALLVVVRQLHLLGIPTEALSGIFLAILLAVAAIASPWAGRLADRSASRSRVAAIGLALLVPGFVVMAAAQGAFLLVLALVLIGGGVGFLNIPLLALLGDLIPADRRGSAVGIFQLFGDGGGSLGPILGDSLMFYLGPALLYGGLALLLTAAVPVAIWLIRAESRFRRVKIA